MNRRADLSVDFGGNFGFERFIEATAFEIIRRAFFRFADVGAAPRSFAGKIQRDFTGGTFDDAQELGFVANFPAAHAAAHFNLFNRGHFLILFFAVVVEVAKGVERAERVIFSSRLSGSFSFRFRRSF